MKVDWKPTVLGKHIDTLKGFAFKSKWYQDQGVPVVRVSDFSENSICTDDIYYVSEAIASNYKRYALEYHDVIIQTVGSWQNNPASIVGKVVYVPKALNNALLNQNAVKVIPKDSIEHRFLYYLLKTNSFRQHNLNHAQGAANQASITLDSIKRFKFKLPPLPIQEKISKTLSAYDDLIENNLKRIELLEEQAQLIYEEWFIRMKFPNHENTAIDSETGLPKGWSVVQLKDICRLTMGQSPKSEFYNLDGKGLPFHQGVKDFGFRFPENTTWSTEGNRIAEQGSILFSVRAPVGRLNVAIEKIVLGRGLAAINHKDGLNSLLLYQLQSIFFRDNLMGGGAIFNSVTKKDVEGIKLVQPSTDLAKKFNALAKNIDDLIKNLTLQNKLLKEARDILLPRLMTGMIEV